MAPLSQTVLKEHWSYGPQPQSGCEWGKAGVVALRGVTIKTEIYFELAHLRPVSGVVAIWWQ
jgi:hypothetical protein